MSLRERLAGAQAKLGLNNQAMAAELRITPEWLSKILNGRVMGSDDIGLRLDELMRRRKLEANSSEAPLVVNEPPPSQESPAGAAPLVVGIRERFQELLAAAGDDPERLYWISAQMREHLSVPSGWQTLDEINVQAIVRAEELNRESLSRRGHQPKTGEQSHERPESA